MSEQAKDLEKKWYVVRVQTGKEERVKEALERLRQARNMQEAISEVIIPIEKIVELRGGKRHIKEKKLFPGYLLINMNMTKETWFAIRETPGIGSFLGLSDPIPLAEHEVERILRTMQSEEERPKIKVSFQKDDIVRVKDGPFENFEGTVKEINEKKGLVKVSMVVFGRATNVELEYWQLEKV
jgi:transcriptional antiterminator NusG